MWVLGNKFRFSCLQGKPSPQPTIVFGRGNPVPVLVAYVGTLFYHWSPFFIPPLPRKVGELPAAKCITLVLSLPELFQALTILATKSSLG